MTHDEIKAALEMCDAATPGQWTWWWPWGAREPILVARPGIKIIMDATRNGMSSAVIRFARRSARDGGGILHKATEFATKPKPRDLEFIVLDHPDAKFIAAARELLPKALKELQAAQIMIEELEQELNAGELRKEKWGT